MPRRSTRLPLKSSQEVVVETVTATPVKVRPVKEVVVEKTEVTTEPEIEIRRPGTLAQALTQPPVAVVKPKTKVRRKVVERKRTA